MVKISRDEFRVTDGARIVAWVVTPSGPTRPDEIAVQKPRASTPTAAIAGLRRTRVSVRARAKIRL